MLDESNRIRPPFTEEEKLATKEQLERLLANPFFSHSRRFPSFLRFIVSHTLSEQTDLLKERTLGVEIFGKDPDYDTANDPIVRVTAAEIRKRIAQYYQDPAHEHELRLSLSPGSYVPQFYPPNTAVAEHVQPSRSSGRAEIDGPLGESIGASSGARTRHSWILPVAAIFSLLLLVAVGAVLWRVTRPSPLDVFWEPVLDSSDPVLFCIADQTQYTAIVLRDAADPTHQIVLRDNLTAVVIDDLTPVVKIAGFLQSNHKKYSVRGEGSTTLMDLRGGPTVFIGAFDNEWTLRLLKPLRYHFFNDATMTHLGVVDSTSHTPSPWTVDRTQQIATNNYRDYAIVARFTDVTTGKLAIVLAGVGRGGTIAAGEFLTDPDLLAPILHAARDKRNIELVLSTPIIGGEPGPPRVEASYTW
jgi:hypothetical protein